MFKSNPVTAGIPLVGPAYGDAGWPVGPFIDAVGATNLGFVTLHYYATNRCHDNIVTISELLDQNRMDAFVSTAKEWVAATNSRGLAVVNGETNSVACEGQKGVSDAFASTVWGLDWLFTNFNVGMQRVNFLANNSYYSPVFVTTAVSPDDSDLIYLNFVAPLYYAMYTFSTQAQNKHILPITLRANQHQALRGARDELQPSNGFRDQQGSEGIGESHHHTFRAHGRRRFAAHRRCAIAGFKSRSIWRSVV